MFMLLIKSETARWNAGPEPKVGRSTEVCGRKTRLAVKTEFENVVVDGLLVHFFEVPNGRSDHLEAVADKAVREVDERLVGVEAAVGAKKVVFGGRPHNLRAGESMLDVYFRRRRLVRVG